MYSFIHKEPDPHDHRLVPVYLMQKRQLMGFMCLRPCLPGDRCHLMLTRNSYKSRLMHLLSMQPFLMNLEKARITHHYCLYMRTMLLGTCETYREKLYVFIIWNTFVIIFKIYENDVFFTVSWCFKMHQLWSEDYEAITTWRVVISWCHTTI